MPQIQLLRLIVTRDRGTSFGSFFFPSRSSHLPETSEDLPGSRLSECQLGSFVHHLRAHNISVDLSFLRVLMHFSSRKGLGKYRNGATGKTRWKALTYDLYRIQSTCQLSALRSTVFIFEIY